MDPQELFSNVLGGLRNINTNLATCDNGKNCKLPKGGTFFFLINKSGQGKTITFPYTWILEFNFSL